MARRTDFDVASRNTEIVFPSSAAANHPGECFRRFDNGEQKSSPGFATATAKGMLPVDGSILLLLFRDVVS